jgi:hypothetical protein
MALSKLQFKPGLNRDQTNYAGEGGYYECDKVRFRSGFPQKIGGWLRFGVFTLIGVCRQMYNYISSFSDNIQVLGTNAKLYLDVGGNLVNITPLRASNPTYTTTATDNCFTTVNGSTTVTVTIVGCTAVVGNYVEISGAVATNGIPAAQLNTNHLILSAPDADNFTIAVTTPATSSGTGGGTAIVVSFEINVGPLTTTYGYGWGVSSWGGVPVTGWGGGTITPLTIFQQDWFTDNFDNDTVANIRDGAIYYWTYTGAFNTRAVLLSSLAGATDVPTEATQVLVSQNDKHLLCFGSTPYGGGSFDPLLIRWANQDEPTNWTPAPTNTAGFIRVSRGSRIVRALPTRQEILVWTDSHLYTLQFTGTTDVFSLQEYADNISIMSPRSCISANNVTYWMGQDKFYAYSGRVETLPCTIRNYVFQDFNYDQNEQVVCGTNEQWHEVWWFYPSSTAQTNDRYVIYNYLERIWYYGNLARTAWLDSPSRRYPQAVGGSFVYNHEEGLNDDTLPMTSFITTNDFDIGDGENLILIKRIIPDIDFNGSTAATPKVVMTMKPRNFPGSNYTNTNEPDVERSTTVPIEQYTEQVFIRARARQMGFKIISEDLGVQWQLGAPRLDGRPDGKR